MDQSAAKQELFNILDLYRRSIIHADDPALAEQVWANTQDVSFTHPRGHASGWQQIKQNFYGKTMGETFSSRELTLVGTPAIRLYGDAAVVEFQWDFVATVRADGSQRHTTGRESQVYVKRPEGWRLVHVHYSGPATTA